MSTKFDQAAELALTLEPAERAELAERLIDSLPPDEQRAIDAAWADEAERRMDEFLAGRAQAIPAEDVFREIESRRR